jgi:coenzyme F420-0:L-glutamate ligase/coenzyme F420-1:gamma-L-glutamate ligase
VTQDLDVQDFWDYLDRLVAESQVVVDRPRGSTHPRYPGLVYPLDYGYLEGTTMVDGGGIDVWVGSLASKIPDSVAMTIDLDKRDAEMKLLLGCTAAEKQIVLDFLNGASMRAWLVHRDMFLGWLHTRRSVRRFQPLPVPRELVERILETATWAPSAHHRQPWRFAVLSTHNAKETLAVSMGATLQRDLLADGLPLAVAEAQVARSHARILEAPLAILLCLDNSLGDAYPDTPRQQAEYLMGVQSVALAGGQLLLAAHAEGLGGVWVCAPLFAAQVARQALDLPEAWQPQALLLLGYPAKIPPPRPRRAIQEITRFY